MERVRVADGAVVRMCYSMGRIQVGLGLGLGCDRLVSNDIQLDTTDWYLLHDTIDWLSHTSCK